MTLDEQREIFTNAVARIHGHLEAAAFLEALDAQHPDCGTPMAEPRVKQIDRIREIITAAWAEAYPADWESLPTPTEAVTA